jgi:hypothetical protein
MQEHGHCVNLGDGEPCGGSISLQPVHEIMFEHFQVPCVLNETISYRIKIFFGLRSDLGFLAIKHRLTCFQLWEKEIRHRQDSL